MEIGWCDIYFRICLTEKEKAGSECPGWVQRRRKSEMLPVEHGVATALLVLWCPQGVACRLTGWQELLQQHLAGG